jgi:hypothetical protein
MLKQKIGSYPKKILVLLNNSNFAVPVFVIGFVVIFYNFVYFISKNSVNIPYWDQWGGVSDTIQGKFDLLKILIYQHNEHRIGLGLLIMKVLAIFSNWSQILEIKFISFLVISSALLLTYVKYSINKKIEILDIVIPLVILNLFQVENITWGFQIAFVLPLFFLSLWVLALKIKFSRRRYAILTILSLASTFSSFHGLILPLLTIAIATIECFKYKSIKRKLFVLATTANILIIFYYFIGYTSKSQTALSLIPSWTVIKFFSATVSRGFFYSANNIFVNVLITATVLIIFIIGIRKLFKYKERNNSLVSGCLLAVFGLIFASMVTTGRSSFGIEQAMRSGYVTFFMLIPVGIFFIISSFKYGNYLKIILLIFLLSNSIFLTQPINWYQKYIIGGKQQALACYKTSTISNLNECYKLFPIYPDETFLDQRIVKALQYKKINKFDKTGEITGSIYSLPNGTAVSRKASELFTDFQNIKIENSDFIALNNDPSMLVTVNDNVKGIAWESSVMGNATAYFTFNEASYFTEKNAFTIKPINGNYIINLEKVREIMGKKIYKIRIDPTDKMENFKIDNLRIFQ